MMNKSSIILGTLVLLVSLVTLAESTHNYKVYVDVNSNCITSKYNKCGRHPWSAFRNLKEALSYVSTYFPGQDSDSDSDSDGWDDNWLDIFGFKKNNGGGKDSHDCFPTIYVSRGVYSGNLNKELNISTPVEIKSKDGPSSTFIDCMGSGNGMRINNNPNFILEGFTIQKCSSNFGGGLFINASHVTMSNMVFRDNFASQGGALAIQSSSVIVSQSTFINNAGIEVANGVLVNDSTVNFINSNLQCANDLYCNSGAVTFDGNTLYSNSSITCASTKECLVTNGDISDSTADDDNYISLCGKVRPVCQINSNQSNNGDSSSCNNDGVCDPLTENCLTCSDCTQCKLTGWKLVSIAGCIPPINNQTGCSNSTTKIQTPEIINFMPSAPCPVAGILSSYVRVKDDGPISIRLQAKNMGVRLYVNNRIQIDAYLSNLTEVDTVREISFVKAHPHTIRLEFFSLFSETRNISLSWRTSNNDPYLPIDGFISQNVCNDQILDEEEKNETSPFYCLSDLQSLNPNNITFTCGDGLCTEVPEECVFDCYSILSPKCPAQAPPAPSLLDPVDTTGMLLNNQYLFSLPGLSNLAHGVDILTGLSRVVPIFAFDYCDNSTFTLLQNSYRYQVYTIPKGVYATLTPSCNYNAETTTYSSSTSMAREKATSTMSSLEANAGGGNSFIKASANVAFTKENSVTKASEIENKISGSLHSTEVKCIISKVHLVDQKLHPIFVRDISHAIDKPQMIQVVKKYGNLYYKSASLGGRLVQSTIVSEDYSSKTDSSEVSNSIDQSYGASINSPVLNVQVQTTKSTSSQVSSEQMKSFEENSLRTTISSFGGPAGIFSPDQDNSFARFSDWANQVDLIPVPIDFKLDYIAELIPSHWKVKNSSQSIRELWMDAEIEWFGQVYPDKIFISRNMTLLQFNFNAAPTDIPNALSLTTIAYNETTDVYEPLLTSNNHTIHNTTTASVEAVFPSIIEIKSLVGLNIPSACFPLTIIDSAMSRSYRFNSIADTPTYVPHQVVVEYTVECADCTDNTYLMALVKGSKDTVKKIFQWKSFKNQKSFTVNESTYIGTILSLNLRIVMTLEEGEVAESKISLQVKSLLISQTCGAPNSDGVDQSGCTPASVPFTTYGYTHVYQPIDAKKVYTVKTIKSYSTIPVIYYSF
ncbi:hypothetical protein DFA_01390 [Cavenderia fasciculata]|uniref:MACPF domain-containing protein n=1 Tax=Cavenderia fasciculata TaxID=261658 RepID=F4PSH4_CACFS|nr:uncharacterized protein DFA_01390 [Cavenderia fasciculata]EGG21504.1 hypothetical protein DFA_01390 [Cavenderia fasciculata]|eukprot:XP_004359354.1 hypothetical protein DFA_01390 [Cavenderia fasciculata]